MSNANKMNPGIEERIRMWQHNATAAMMALRSVEPSGDWSKLVIIIADMRDPIARQLTEAMAHETKEGFDLKAEEEKVERKGQIPTATLVLPVEDAKRIFAILDHPVVAANIGRAPPNGHLRAVVISSGACSLMHPPIIELGPSAVS
jgi:hypothetical protein